METRDFIQGDRYRDRVTAACERLDGFEYAGLDIQRVLFDSISGAATWNTDATASRSGPLAAALASLTPSKRQLLELLETYSLSLTQHRCSSPDGEVWVLWDGSRSTVSEQLRRVVGASPAVVLEVDQQLRLTDDGLLDGTVDTVSELPVYGSLTTCLAQRLRGTFLQDIHELALEVRKASTLAEAARELFTRHQPRALFVYRDFKGVGDALVQVAAQQGIPTYSTQHAVHPEFTGAHDRPGNLVYENSHSDTYICWGPFPKEQVTAHLDRAGRSRRLTVCSRPSAPEEKQLQREKTSDDQFDIEELFVPLMGLRHEDENTALLDQVFAFAAGTDYTIRIRPHPSLAEAKYREYISQLEQEHDVPATLVSIKLAPLPSYTPETLAITGLTSMYYESLLHGVPTIFVDHGLELQQSLPRVLSPVRSDNQLRSQVARIESSSYREWYKDADPVCNAVYNRECLDFEPKESLVEFINRDLDR